MLHFQHPVNHTRSSSCKVRQRFLVATLVVVGALAFVFGKPIQDRLSLILALRSDAPAQDWVFDLIERSAKPARVLQTFWDTGKTVHRQQVVTYLKNRAESDALLVEELHGLLVEATRDADASVRERALGALANANHPDLLPLAQAQLRDVDPELRLFALLLLARLDAHTRSLTPVFVGLLDDADLRIVTAAEGALRRWTGVDFGVRGHQAVPQRDPQTGVESLVPSQMAAIHDGVAQRKDWWNQREEEYSSTSTEPPSSLLAVKPACFLAADFTLHGLAGQKIRLSDFRGKTVLLNFWTTWCMPCLREMPDLVELQKRLADKLVILGVSLDGIPHGHDHAAAEQAGHYESEETHDAKSERKRVLAKVERVARSRGLNYPVLIDWEGKLGDRFNGGELPTNVLIDPQGCVRRRFIGPRSIPVWETMIAELESVSRDAVAGAGF